MIRLIADYNTIHYFVQYSSITRTALRAVENFTYQKFWLVSLLLLTKKQENFCNKTQSTVLYNPMRGAGTLLESGLGKGYLIKGYLFLPYLPIQVVHLLWSFDCFPL